MSDNKEKATECTGKTGFCWPWHDFSKGSAGYKDAGKGIGFMEMRDMKTSERTRDIPFLKYGAKKGDSVSLNFCPFCGADYEKLGRI